MKLNGKAWMSFAFMLVAIGVIVSASQWPFKAALFPMVCGVPLLILCAIQFYVSSFKKRGHAKGETVDFKLTEMEDKALARKRTVNIFLWILGFFFLVLLVGFPIAVPLFVFSYMKLQGKEKWKTAIAYTFVAWLSFYGLFVKFCELPFMEGWVQQGLTKLGVL